MASLCLFAGVLALAVAPAAAHSDSDYANMGPMGFMWPKDREWVDDAHAMRGPCGSSDSVAPVNRTSFPLADGILALEQKQHVFDVQVSITFDEAPSNTSDFDVLIPQDRIRALDFSHVCIDLPALPTTAAEGRNATIRLRYVAEYLDPNHSHDRRRHLPVNETFYSCADVTLMALDEFYRDNVPCFNATGDFDNDEEHSHSHSHDDEEEAEEVGSGSSSSGLSKGDIAGIVIGSIVGVAVIATALWYFIRKDRREKQMAQRMAGDKAPSIAE
ncbi:hypothetical protein F5X68DRAFT_198336 [Plectosphaerella plurivora]|uniref:Copper acquisition factor BIM1-like domain-containing protein n=1 Tax=Plectosphaerella plurivora TaxID=936078 RepID=A0A9P9AER9_9PEZI|nr:hypothetical protein F5X68DRAFT_198336 [Plectosphaerella plurivora]